MSEPQGSNEANSGAEEDGDKKRPPPDKSWLKTEIIHKKNDGGEGTRFEK